jgi:hypothetical protein
MPLLGASGSPSHAKGWFTVARDRKLKNSTSSKVRVLEERHDCIQVSDQNSLAIPPFHSTLHHLPNPSFKQLLIHDAILIEESVVPSSLAHAAMNKEGLWGVQCVSTSEGKIYRKDQDVRKGKGTKALAT